jgi:hypothetical protein
MAFGEGRLQPPGIAAGRLDLDDFHSEIVQYLAAKRSHGGAQVENTVAGEKRSCVGDFNHGQGSIEVLNPLISRMDDGDDGE